MLINYDSKMVNFTAPKKSTIVKSDCLKSINPYDKPINLHESEMFEESIVYFHNVLSKEMQDHIIEICEIRGEWQKAITTGESSGKVNSENSARQNDLCFISSCPKFKELDTHIHKVFNAAMQEYMSLIGVGSVFDAGLTADEGYSLLRYGPNQFYRTHIDYSSQSSQGQNPIIRAVSGLIYINDDYEGGEIYFKRQKLKIKPTAGGVVFFPSIYTHPHTSLDIKSGTKYCIVSWWK